MNSKEFMLAKLEEQAKRIEELEAEINEIHATGGCSYQRLAKAESRIEAAMDIGEIHPSWGASEEYEDGWRECRKMFREALGGSKTAPSNRPVMGGMYEKNSETGEVTERLQEDEKYIR